MDKDGRWRSHDKRQEAWSREGYLQVCIWAEGAGILSVEIPWEEVEAMSSCARDGKVKYVPHRPRSIDPRLLGSLLDEEE